MREWRVICDICGREIKATEDYIGVTLEWLPREKRERPSTCTREACRGCVQKITDLWTVERQGIPHPVRG